MNTKEKHVRENESLAQKKEHEHLDPNQLAESLPANGRRRHNENTGKINRLWLWLGVLVLIFILLYWLFSIGIFGDMTGFFNG